VNAIKKKHTEDVSKLDKVITELKSNLVTLKWQTVQYETEEKQFLAICKHQQDHLANLAKKEREQKEKIALLEVEKKEV
jgi:tRNA A37 threonylcarbamoyladenosine modification protein TsaB